MKEYAAIPGHQLQKDYVYVAAEIVVMDSSHKFTFGLSMTCK